jgi:mannose-6-phosphate isomerase-like protein (cupin superfamily)
VTDPEVEPGDTEPVPDDPAVIDCPPSGKRVRVRESAADTDGRRFRFDMWLDPPARSHGPMLHVHPEQDEDLAVVSGRLGVVVDGDSDTLEAGESVTVPKGVPHRFWNAGSGTLHVVGEVRPALRTEEFMRVTYGLARDGRSTPSGMPLNPLRLAPLVERYDDMLYLARLPVSIQKRAVSLLAPVGRAVGYDTEYPEYRTPG